MGDLKKTAVIVLSCAAMLVAVAGVYEAIHSPLFTVQVVEVTDQVSTDQISTGQAEPRHVPDAADGADAAMPWTPVDPQTVTDLAAVPVGQANLFDLDLKAVEKRILSNDWIREVRLQKRFPQTLSITAIFREPCAVIELATGSLAYVDDTGTVFGNVSLAGPKELPLISGIDAEDAGRLKNVLSLLSSWRAQQVSKFARIESMTDDPVRGDRLLVSYPISVSGEGRRIVHARVDLGAWESEKPSFADLTRVFGYLHAHGIAARQIWADAGKKIVVKTAHGS